MSNNSALGRRFMVFRAQYHAGIQKGFLETFCTLKFKYSTAVFRLLDDGCT
jgi:hypothetical protein